MASQPKGKSSKTLIERPGINWRPEDSSLIVSAVKEAAMLAPIAELKKAACSALLIFKTTQIVKENKEAYERLGYDSSGLIIAIWRSFKKAEDPETWLSAEMRDILEDLSHTLEIICSFVNGQLSKSKAIRVIFSRSDGVKINEYREQLNYAMQKFELQSHMNVNDVLMRVMKKDDLTSEEILRRNEEVKPVTEMKTRDARDREIAENFQQEEWEISMLEQLKQIEMNRQTEDEQWRSDELKRIEKETKDRKSELERLRVAARELQEANRLMEAEEEKIAQLKRALAAKEDNRQSNRIRRARSSEENLRSSRQEDEEENKEWEGNFTLEEATSEEEDERPVRRSSKAKRSASGSAKRLPVAAEDSTDDEEDLQPFRSSSSRLRTARRKLSGASLPEEDLHSTSMRSANLKVRIPRRNVSSASLRIQETDDDYTDTDEDEEDDSPSPSRKSPKVRRKPQTLSISLPRQVDDLMTRFQGLTPVGLDSDSRSGSPIYVPGVNPYFPTYGAPFSPPYGYGHVGMPGLVVNAGVGNIVNTHQRNTILLIINS